MMDAVVVVLQLCHLFSDRWVFVPSSVILIEIGMCPFRLVLSDFIAICAA